MNCIEQHVKIPFTVHFDEIEKCVKEQFADKFILRFISAHFDKNYFYAHLLIGEGFPPNGRCVFSFNKRTFHNQNKFNVCFLIPTGIGCEIGGHAGDATAVLKMTASLCDKVVTHPNVVNASDINEMPNNALYVEGSHLTQLLMGSIGLAETRSNRILAVIEADPENNEKFKTAAVNSVNAARAVLGAAADIAVLNPPINMEGFITNDKAHGCVSNLNHLYKLLKNKQSSYDAVAVASKIKVGSHLHKEYSQSNGEMINPWGAAEAMLTHFISSEFCVPSAHAPMLESKAIAKMDFGVVDARIAPEVVSTTFLHCVLKGLNKAPKIIKDASLIKQPHILSAKDISALVIPDGILGLPVLAALHQGIKVIAVKNNNTMQNNLSKLPWDKGQFYQCGSYLEAAGMLNCFKTGVSVESVKRPLKTLMLKPTKEQHESLPQNGFIKQHLNLMT